MSTAAARAMPSVAWIRVVRPASMPDDRGRQSARSTVARASGGSGIVLSKEGLILTSEHVIRGASDVAVVLSDGSRHEVERSAVAERLDLALLRIRCRDLTPMAEAPASATSARPVVAVAGGHFPADSRARCGLISDASCSLQGDLDPACRRDYHRLIETTAPIEPGFSGGPLLDIEGNLVGINVATAEGTDGTRRGYAIVFDARTRQVVAELVARVNDSE